MITLPKYIAKCVYQVEKNSVWRCYAEEDITIDNTDRSIIKSLNPFVLEIDGTRILLTSKIDSVIPEDCSHALLINHQINTPKFLNESFEIKQWLKHPLINLSETPADVFKSWRGKFTFLQEDKELDEPGLREPQVCAIHAFLSRRYNLKDRANIVMPTGTGKTETMLGIMIAAQCKKILVTVPHDALRWQIFEKFLTLGCLRKFGIVKDDCKYPFVSIVSTGMTLDGWKEILSRSNVIISTMPLLSQTSDDVRKYLSKEITNIFVDEAHHTEAPTWSKFLDVFPKTRIVQFTATPFRNDGRKLRGEFIYTFSLRSAQQQGYYQNINFKPVYEIDKKKADAVIARRAVEILRKDIESGKNHILMARCKDKQRADSVFEHYKVYEDLKPVVIYSGISGQRTLLDEIKRGDHRIVVCVNMLGEGFDLPQLKIAAIHDEKQSLPITLQFIGRFTRTAGNNIGEASFVTNMAYPPMAEDIRDLYLKDADWNIIIPGLNDRTTSEEIEFADLLNEFPNLNEAEIPFQSINPALSTVIYRLDRFEWTPENWHNVYTEKEYDYRYANVNDSDDMLVIILGRLEGLDWSNYEGIQNRMWDVILLHKYDAGNYKHLYINSSHRGDSFDKLVEQLFGAKQEQLSGDNMFRSFHGLKRILVQNFGGRKAISGDISFKSYVGRDVENGIREAEQKKIHQNNIFASALFNGERITHGCSKKGKVWSYRRGNLLSFKNWTHRIGALIEDPSIPNDELFKYTLKVNPVASCHNSVPVAVDWDDDVYQNIGVEQFLSIEGFDQEVNLFDTSIEVTSRVWNSDQLPSDILFQITYGDLKSKYRISYSSEEIGDETKYSYSVERVGGPKLKFRVNRIKYDDIIEYFNTEKRSPVFFFADGSFMYANNLITLRQLTTPFNQEDLVSFDWGGIDLNEESMDWPHKENSIQYYMWKKIEDDYEFIFDDDGSGEVADLIGVNQDEKAIYVNLYHLKYAAGGKVSRLVSNFYEVCGQAQKSLKWKNDGMDIFRKLIGRTQSTAKGENRILKGDVESLKQLSQDALFRKKVIVSLHIVQPGLSKADAPIDILELLGVVKNYAYEVCNAQISVYCSE